MTIKDRFLALFTKAGVPVEEAEAELDAITFSDEAEDNSAEIAKFAQRQQEMQDTIARLQAERIENEAATFARDLRLEQKRITTAEEPLVTALFAQAMKDDNANADKVTFSQNGEAQNVSRVDALKALFSLRESHQWTEELFKETMENGEGAVLFSKMQTAKQGEEKPFTPERRRELLSETAEGRAILAAERNK